MMITQSPEQPAISEWAFIEELKVPLHRKIHWDRLVVSNGEVNLGNGVTLEFKYRDERNCLETAYCDFQLFLHAGGIGTDGGYRIIVTQGETECYEAYCIDVTEKVCYLTANDTEGIRRGLVYLEDEILRHGGPFLSIGKIERKPLIKTRISRCFFGPIKRPPLNRDELIDDVNYYPDEYLNKLAHEGINGLWLTISFQDLCPSKYFPSHGKDCVKRYEKLKTIVKQCARYGIKIYVFCIEPWAFGEIEEYQRPVADLDAHPELGGHKSKSFTAFCTSTEEGQAYLTGCTHAIFSAVPELGGLIAINLGERPTHCYSENQALLDNNCPICSKRNPGEVFADTTAALARGMQEVNPQAEMISWLYVPFLGESQKGDIDRKKAVIRDVAAHMPDNVVMQYNYESNGMAMQLGKERVALDYWLSYIGPSKIFSDCAEKAIAAGARVSAKIQVGCSHEVATVPFLPVPGNLYKKYQGMHELGVSSVMQCWYFGNYPGLMNKAAGELSFAPLPADENEFLLKMAKTEWGRHADTVVNAWKKFQEAYSHFPVNLSFTWFGPVHHSIVWPLYLSPVDKPIAPSWTFSFPLESGDRIGECICYDHTLDEVLLLTENMAEIWNDGVAFLKQIENDYTGNIERRRDLGLACALGIQFRSTANVVKFYSLREKLPYMEQYKQVLALESMKDIVKHEIALCSELKVLCIEDDRLGFHSEAEGYKYFPAKLDWRVEQLEALLQKDFPDAEALVNNGSLLFPEYTGIDAHGSVYRCGQLEADAEWMAFVDSSCQWKASCDDKNMYISIKHNDGAECAISVDIEPCRLWPVQVFRLNKNGDTCHMNLKTTPDTSWRVDQEGNTARFVIPFKLFDGYYRGAGPMRINLSCGDNSWVSKHPYESRLRFGTHNPADLGWLFFDAE